MQLTASTHCAPLAIARPTGRKLTLKLRATGDNSVATPPTPVSKVREDRLWWLPTNQSSNAHP